MVRELSPQFLSVSTMGVDQPQPPKAGCSEVCRLARNVSDLDESLPSTHGSTSQRRSRNYLARRRKSLRDWHAGFRVALATKTGHMIRPPPGLSLNQLNKEEKVTPQKNDDKDNLDENAEDNAKPTPGDDDQGEQDTQNAEDRFCND